MQKICFTKTAYGKTALVHMSLPVLEIQPLQTQNESEDETNHFMMDNGSKNKGLRELPSPC